MIDRENGDPGVTGESEHVFKWEIEPHPYDSQFDFMVTDSDEEAREAILCVAESHLWDQHDGGTRTITVKHNVAPAAPPQPKAGAE